MAPDVEIRRLTVSDLDAYKALRDALLAAHPDAFTSDIAEARMQSADSYRERLDLDRPEGGHFTLGAWHGSELVGAVSADRETRLKTRHITHLTAMMVRNELAGQGIGRALLDTAIDAARRADGVEMVTLSVTACNLAALRLYDRAGFVRYASLPHAVKLDGRYLTKDQMVLVL